MAAIISCSSLSPPDHQLNDFCHIDHAVRMIFAVSFLEIAAFLPVINFFSDLLLVLFPPQVTMPQDASNKSVCDTRGLSGFFFFFFPFFGGWGN